MDTVELYTIVAIVLLIFTIGAFLYVRPSKKEADVDDKFYSRIALAEEILNRLKDKENIEVFRARLENCKKLYETRMYEQTEDCVNGILNDLKKGETEQKKEDEAQEVSITCSKCGTKFLKKYDSCPICGAKL